MPGPSVYMLSNSGQAGLVPLETVQCHPIANAAEGGSGTKRSVSRRATARRSRRTARCRQQVGSRVLPDTGSFGRSRSPVRRRILTFLLVGTCPQLAATVYISRDVEG